MLRHVELYRQGERPKWVQHEFLEVRARIPRKSKRGFELIDVITYRIYVVWYRPQISPTWIAIVVDSIHQIFQ